MGGRINMANFTTSISTLSFLSYRGCEFQDARSRWRSSWFSGTWRLRKHGFHLWKRQLINMAFLFAWVQHFVEQLWVQTVSLSTAGLTTRIYFRDLWFQHLLAATSSCQKTRVSRWPALGHTSLQQPINGGEVRGVFHIFFSLAFRSCMQQQSCWWPTMRWSTQWSWRNATLVCTNQWRYTPASTPGSLHPRLPQHQRSGLDMGISTVSTIWRPDHVRKHRPRQMLPHGKVCGLFHHDYLTSSSFGWPTVWGDLPTKHQERRAWNRSHRSPTGSGNRGWQGNNQRASLQQAEAGIDQKWSNKAAPTTPRTPDFGYVGSQQLTVNKNPMLCAEIERGC